MASIAAKFLQSGGSKQEEKKLIEYIKPVDETISKTLFERAMIQVNINKCLKDLILSIQYSPATSIKIAISNIAHKIKHGFCGLV